MNQRGGLDFSVDSAVTGPGSVKFATLAEKLTLTTNTFQLLLNKRGMLKSYSILSQLYIYNIYIILYDVKDALWSINPLSFLGSAA